MDGKWIFLIMGIVALLVGVFIGVSKCTPAPQTTVIVNLPCGCVEKPPVQVPAVTDGCVPACQKDQTDSSWCGKTLEDQGGCP